MRNNQYCAFILHQTCFTLLNQIWCCSNRNTASRPSVRVCVNAGWINAGETELRTHAVPLAHPQRSSLSLSVCVYLSHPRLTRAAPGYACAFQSEKPPPCRRLKAARNAGVRADRILSDLSFGSRGRAALLYREPVLERAACEYKMSTRTPLPTVNERDAEHVSQSYNDHHRCFKRFTITVSIVDLKRDTDFAVLCLLWLCVRCFSLRHTHYYHHLFVRHETASCPT